MSTYYSSGAIPGEDFAIIQEQVNLDDGVVVWIAEHVKFAVSGKIVFIRAASGKQPISMNLRGKITRAQSPLK